jgi:DNA-binding transcriptional LysR family regulator
MAGFNERILNGISVFAAIVDAGTFAAAGERLGMSQPGVSRAIARLEARLQIRLFDRTTRSVSLTDDGRRFFEQVMPHLAGLEEAATLASGSANAVRGRLRVNVDPIFSRLVLGPKLDAFMSAYSSLDLELITSDRLGDMIADGFDLAIRFGEPRASSLIARKLLDTPVHTVAAPSYLARCGRPATPQALASEAHTCIDFRDPQTGRPFAWEFHRGKKRVSVETRGHLTLNDPGTMLSAVLSGLGVAQILALGHEHLLAQGQLVDLFPDWPDERFPLYAFYPSRHHPPAKTRAFLDFAVSLTSSP